MLIEETMHLMATTISVHLAVADEDEPPARRAIAAGMAWFADVATRFSRFITTSELSELNAANGRWHTVSAPLFTVIAMSIDAATASDGLFDPALLPLLEALGYARDFADFAHAEARSAWRVDHQAVYSGGWRAIKLDVKKKRVWLPVGVRLDLGGIVKGWAADVALARFFGHFAHVLINVGGDMRARGGTEEGAVWPIGIGDARLHDLDGDVPHVAVVTLGQGGLATSGATDRWWFRAGERQHHLIDPRHNRPAHVWIDHSDDDAAAEPLIATATALAPTTAHAEVAAKVALLRGYPQALAAVEHAWQTRREASVRSYGDADVALLLVLGTGVVKCSANFQEYLETRGGGEIYGSLDAIIAAHDAGRCQPDPMVYYARHGHRRLCHARADGDLGDVAYHRAALWRTIDVGG